MVALLHEFLRNFELNKLEIGEAAALVVVDGLSEEEAAKRWLKRFESNLPKWQEFDCNNPELNSV